MNKAVYDSSIIASASKTSKSQNQDSSAEFEENDLKAIFIADGLGSFKYPKLASERVVEFLREKILMQSLKNTKLIYSQLEETFYQAKQDLVSFAKKNITESEKKEQLLFGTTVIALFEIGNKILIAYVGNGAIWHVRGNFTDFSNSYHFPWNAINYLNPHTTPEQGKEALYRLISDNPHFDECRPTVLEIEKDPECGDIFMICTDGIYSADQLKTGKNDKGIWVRYEPSMLKYFEHLKAFFKSRQMYGKENLEKMLDAYLEELKPKLDDDATIGVLITKEALTYQTRLIG